MQTDAAVIGYPYGVHATSSVSFCLLGDRHNHSSQLVFRRTVSLATSVFAAYYILAFAIKQAVAVGEEFAPKTTRLKVSKEVDTDIFASLAN